MSETQADADHPEAAAGTTPWPHSGRGERRPQTGRAARTNHPLVLPPGLNGQSPAGRRWRDLVEHYSVQLGPERMRNESIRARLRSLVWLTLEIERCTDERVCDKPVAIHTLLHMGQELRVLLAELGLKHDEPQPRPSPESEPGPERPTSLADYLAKPEEAS